MNIHPAALSAIRIAAAIIAVILVELIVYFLGVNTCKQDM